MLVTNGEAVELVKLTTTGVGRGEHGPRIQSILELRMQIEDPERVKSAAPVIAQALLDSVEFGDADGESRNTLSVRIGRDFPHMVYRFCAVGISAVAGEEGAKIDPNMDGAMRVDRKAVFSATVKGTPEARIVSGVLELRWKIEGMVELNDHWRLATMVGIEGVTLTTSSVQGDLFAGAKSEQAH